MKRIDATVYVRDSRFETIVFVDDNASDERIEEAIKEDINSMIEIEWHEVKSERGR